MALKKTVELYGFGSYFERRQARYNDIDLLIIHTDYWAESIELALLCKRGLMAVIPTAHITILSSNEELELDYKLKCKAIPLGVVNRGNIRSRIKELDKLIRAFDELDRPMQQVAEGVTRRLSSGSGGLRGVYHRARIRATRWLIHPTR
jgi:hypothetical protein